MTTWTVRRALFGWTAHEPLCERRSPDGTSVRWCAFDAGSRCSWFPAWSAAIKKAIDEHRGSMSEVPC